MKTTAPKLRARMAGALYLLALMTAASGEMLFHGELAYALGLIAVAGMAVMTLLFYAIFRPVNRSLSMMAAGFNLVGLVFEAIRVNPRGVDIALVFDGVFCLLVGYLIFKSHFLPRILAAPMALAGLGWLTFASPWFASELAPFNLACGVLGQGSVCLWLLAMGVNAEQWQQQDDAMRAPGA